MDAKRIKAAVLKAYSRGLFVGANMLRGAVTPRLNPDAAYQAHLAEAAAAVQIRRGPLETRAFENVIFHPDYNALYRADGELIAETALRRSPSLRAVKCPDRIEPPARFERMIPEAMYGGALFDNHYGHFLTETLSRLWPLAPGAEAAPDLPWVFRRTSWRAPFSAIDGPVRDTLAAVPGLQERIVTPEEVTLIGKAHVPESAHIVGFAGHESFRRLCAAAGQTILERAGLAGETRYHGRSVYLSRSRLSARNRLVIDEGELEVALRRRGFMIVHPETLTLAEQVAIFNGAERVAACIGSALHTALLAPRQGLRAVYLTGPAASVTYMVIDRLCGIDARYVQALWEPPWKNEHFLHNYLDMDRALAAIDAPLGPGSERGTP